MTTPIFPPLPSVAYPGLREPGWTFRAHVLAVAAKLAADGWPVFGVKLGVLMKGATIQVSVHSVEEAQALQRGLDLLEFTLSVVPGQPLVVWGGHRHGIAFVGIVDAPPPPVPSAKSNGVNS